MSVKDFVEFCNDFINDVFMKRVLLIICIAVLAFANLYLWGQLRIERDNFYPIAKNQTEEALLSYQAGFEVMLMNDGIALDSVRYYDLSEKVELPLSSQFNDSVSHYFVMRYNEYDCEACVEYAYQKMAEVFANEKDVDIMIVKNMVENQQSTSMELAYGKNTIKRLDIVNMELPIDAAGVPHYFILDKDMKIHDMFVPDRLNPAVTDVYLERIVQKWFKE